MSNTTTNTGTNDNSGDDVVSLASGLKALANTYIAARTAADASMAQALTDATSANNAHTALQVAIARAVAADEALDPANASTSAASSSSSSSSSSSPATTPTDDTTTQAPRVGITPPVPVPPHLT